jgi:hypothetical protein
MTLTPAAGTFTFADVPNTGWKTYSVSFINAFDDAGKTLYILLSKPTAGDQVLVDNVHLTAEALPEPASLAALVLPAVAMLRARRRA